MTDRHIVAIGREHNNPNVAAAFAGNIGGVGLDLCRGKACQN
jgi:hypothetical protein